jgi:hypothetical protein
VGSSTWSPQSSSGDWIEQSTPGSSWTDQQTGNSNWQRAA